MTFTYVAKNKDGALYVAHDGAILTLHQAKVYNQRVIDQVREGLIYCKGWDKPVGLNHLRLVK